MNELKKKQPKTFEQSKIIANQGGAIAGNTRKEIEAKTGEKVIISQSALEIRETKKLK